MRRNLFCSEVIVEVKCIERDEWISRIEYSLENRINYVRELTFIKMVF